MKCDICKKNEATIHIQEIVNNNIKTLHLCEECAKAYGLKTELMEIGFNLVEFLNNIDENNVSVAQKVENKLPAFKDMDEEIFFEDENIVYCPECGITFNNFLETGKAGCGYCYTAFKNQIKPLLRRIHGRTLHIGKVPFKLKEALTINREIITLENKLKLAVKSEKYKEAARLRDKIKALKNSLQEKGKVKYANKITGK